MSHPARVLGSIRPASRKLSAPSGPRTLRIERRREDREPAAGAVPATYSGNGRYGITHLELVDRSPAGIGARTRTRIEPGMIVTICPEGSRVPWLLARATRCTPEGEGFRVGLAFDHRRAA